MRKKKTLPLTFFVSFFLFKSIFGDDDCCPSACSSTGPQVRFPFRLIGRQLPRCGFPGFDLSCGQHNQTLIHLPPSRSYVVKQISYSEQVIDIDPGFCQPGKIVDFNLTGTGTPFVLTPLRSYTFFNCSLQNPGFIYQTIPVIWFDCLGSLNHSVFAVRTDWYPPGEMPVRCRDMGTISVPVGRYGGDIREEVEMTWFTPFCRTCELEGKTCGLMDDGEIACSGSSSRGIPRSAKYGLTLGIGIPAIMCLAGFVCYIFGKARNHNRSHHQNIDLFSITVTPQLASSTGLDVATIESYPKTVIGENYKLPTDDGTCSICLSDYKPKESLKTIPDCNHYFHAECIDEWLKLNATCPVCRKSPKSSSSSSHTIN